MEILRETWYVIASISRGARREALIGAKLLSGANLVFLSFIYNVSE